MEVKRPLLEVLRDLSSHSADIHSSWLKLLKRYEPCRKHAALLAGLHLVPQAQDLRSANPQAYQEESERLERRVDSEREKAAADAREAELQRNLLGGVDGKLFRCRHELSPRDGWTSGRLTGRGWKRSSPPARAASRA